MLLIFVQKCRSLFLLKFGKETEFPPLFPYIEISFIKWDEQWYCNKMFSLINFLIFQIIKEPKYDHSLRSTFFLSLKKKKLVPFLINTNVDIWDEFLCEVVGVPDKFLYGLVESGGDKPHRFQAIRNRTWLGRINSLRSSKEGLLSIVGGSSCGICCGCNVLSEKTRRFNFHGFPHSTEVRKLLVLVLILVWLACIYENGVDYFQAITTVAYFSGIVVGYSIIHIGILYQGVRARSYWIVKAEPKPIILGIGATITAFLPVAYTLGSSLSDSELNKLG